jgi:glucuronate isomerase
MIPVTYNARVPRSLVLHPDRLFPADAETRALARSLYGHVHKLPIISPHGHTDPAWFAYDQPFGNAVDLLLAPDHYLYRMLYSQGVPLEQLGVRSRRGAPAVEPREAWRQFASRYTLFRGTPSSLWLDQVFAEVFGLTVRLAGETADLYFDAIGAALASPAFRPRALFDRFNIEVLATTESPTDTLEAHQAIRRSGWRGRVISTYRPDPVVDPEHELFRDALEQFGTITKQDVLSWRGYLEAHRIRRGAFAALGTTATDHGHLTAATADLPDGEAQALFAKIVSGDFAPGEAELFRAQMLTEMAKMSLDDGMVMQIHPGAFRNHNRAIFASHGRDKGADIPQQTDYVRALKPLLDRFGNHPRLAVIVFTLDETTYSRELAPPPVITRCSSSAPPGGFTTAQRACGVSASRRRRPQASTTLWASMTTPARFCPFRRATIWHAGLIAAFWHDSWLSTV